MKKKMSIEQFNEILIGLEEGNPVKAMMAISMIAEGTSAYMVPEERYKELYETVEDNKLPTIRLIHLEMLSLCMTVGNPFIKDRATEFASLQSFNEWMEEIAKQNDCDEYFPKVAKIGAKLLIVPSPCKIV